MKNNKSTGYDGLPAEISKKGGDAKIRWMQVIFNAVRKEGRIPDNWEKAVLCPVFKNKGDRADCGNYRGISLLPHTTKIHERILEWRLHSLAEERLGEWKYGFRPNRSTADLITGWAVAQTCCISQCAKYRKTGKFDYPWGQNP